MAKKKTKEEIERALSQGNVAIEFARAYDHGWLRRLPEDASFATLEDLERALDGDIGANTPSSFPGGRCHTSVTGRVRWDVSLVNGVSRFSVLRPAQPGQEAPQGVIWVEVSGSGKGRRLARPDTDLVHLADYHARHVVEIRRVLLALTTIPANAGGLTNRVARVAANMVAAGAR